MAHHRALPSLIAAAALLGCSPGASREVTPWTTQFGVSGEQTLTGLGVGADGSVVLTGGFTQEINLGGGALDSAGDSDIFVAMLDDTAGPRWSGRTGSLGEQSGRAIAVAANGDVLLTGNFTGAISFGHGKFNAGSPSIFLARFDAVGQPIWVRTIGGDKGSVYVASLAETKDGGVVIGGRFYDEVSFGGAPLTAPGQAAYVAKFDADGGPVFSVGFGGQGHAVTALTVDTTGSIVVTGVNNGTIELGGGSFNSSGQSIFITRLDPGGALSWMAQLGDPGVASARAVAVDLVGDVFVAGEFDSALSFGDKDVSAQSYRDGFVAKLSQKGTPLWLAPFGSGIGSAGVHAAVADAAGHIVFTGLYAGSVDFGGGALTQTDHSLAFLAELDGDGHHVASRSFESADPAGSSSGEALALDVQGGLVLGGTFDDSIQIDGQTLTSKSSSDIFLVREKR